MTEILNMQIPLLLLIGVIIIVGFYLGKSMKYVRLPSIVGFMLLGVFAGPSFFDLLSEAIQHQLSFITEIALGFVAVSIGIELKMSSLKRLGSGIIYIILFESFGAFILVFLSVWILSGSLPMALIIGAIAPASAPAGTVAVIKEYRARGSLTKALYAVVGFDDGLGVMIFGFAAAVARILLIHETGSESENFILLILHPLQEIGLSFLFGFLLSLLFSLLTRKMEQAGDVLIILFGFILASTGLCKYLHLSLILTNMVIGMVIVNTQRHHLVQNIHNRLPVFMPLLFILFFTLAGANLHISTLPSLGILGIVYILSRSAGLVGGSRLGAMIGHVEPKIKKYVGLGILSQAGVAIGLSLIVKHEFQGIGRILDGGTKTTGDILGATVITTITAACIFFEIIGPILTKIALKKAGEIEIDEN